ncbi:hypothetical protein AcV5_010439 [Taiwanofungus camphoratus]|nr:hypothetical protein AcV5_010439 [Antrodia cinnamomea]
MARTLLDVKNHELDVFGHVRARCRRMRTPPCSSLSLPSTAMAPPPLDSTLYVPIVSPPTPAPSPRPGSPSLPIAFDPTYLSRTEFAVLPPVLRLRYLSALLSDCTPAELLFVNTTIAPLLKRDFLRELPPEVAIHILSFIDDPRTLVRASRVSKAWNRLVDDPCLWKRMCAIHGYDPVDDLPSIASDNTTQLPDESDSDEDETEAATSLAPSSYPGPSLGKRPVHSTGSAPDLSTFTLHPAHSPSSFSYRNRFKYAHTIVTNWEHGGKLLRTHRVPLQSASQPLALPHTANTPEQPPAPSSAIPTSVAIDDNWVVVGLANSRIHVFSARTGVLSRTLVGHQSGVWAVALIKGGESPEGPVDDDVDRECDDSGGVAERTEDMSADTDIGQEHLIPPTLRHALGLDQVPDGRARRRSASEVFSDINESQAKRHAKRQTWSTKLSDPSGASDGWGQPNALVVSGGCDKELRVWDVKSGYCIYVLRGHTSTIRCLKVLHGRPLAVSGARDRTVRVWDVQRGCALRVCAGHEQSVRCLDVCGRRIVSGSYDCTCRVWDAATGACLHVLRGHFHQIYSVAFDGTRIASGGLDTTVRVWDAATGTCLALLQGHTALVCQLQLSPTLLATGGSDGRVITFALGASFAAVQRLAAHDSSVTGLQLGARFLVTSGNDGRVRLFRRERERGAVGARFEYVRELSEPSESVWKVVCTRETCAVMCKRGGKTVMEIWSFRPEADA